jgi:hypothetical protein
MYRNTIILLIYLTPTCLWDMSSLSKETKILKNI